MTVWGDRLSSLELVAVLSLLDQGEALSAIGGPEAEPGIRKLVQLYSAGYLSRHEAHGAATEQSPSPEQPYETLSEREPLEPRTERWLPRQVS